ncbi:MAG: hypothetical protein AB7P03_18505 [Kofleriaceae bacterium]
MSNWTQVFALAAALGAGCLGGGSKNKCETSADCLGGAACVESVCVASGPGDGTEKPDAGDDHEPALADASDNPGGAFGTVEPLTSQSAGLTTVEYDTMLGLTTASSGLGCALVGNMKSSPGTATAAVYALINKGGSGDTRCPDGTFAIMDHPEFCSTFHPLLDINPGCGIYKRWDATGTLVAKRYAIGGYVTSQSTYHSEMHSTCNVELSLAFDGGVTIDRTYTFDYNPFAPTSAFCVH